MRLLAVAGALVGLLSSALAASPPPLRGVDDVHMVRAVRGKTEVVATFRVFSRATQDLDLQKATKHTISLPRDGSWVTIGTGRGVTFRAKADLRGNVFSEYLFAAPGNVQVNPMFGVSAKPGEGGSVTGRLWQGSSRDISFRPSVVRSFTREGTTLVDPSPLGRRLHNVYRSLDGAWMKARDLTFQTTLGSGPSVLALGQFDGRQVSLHFDGDRMTDVSVVSRER